MVWVTNIFAKIHRHTEFWNLDSDEYATADGTQTGDHGTHLSEDASSEAEAAHTVTFTTL